MCAPSQLDAEDVWDLMCPTYLGDGVVGVYKCFVDDSKDSQQSRMFVCAGWIAEREIWLDFSKRWNARLQGDGISYFKTSEYKMLNGQFERFRKLPAPDGRNAAKAVRDDLLDIIRDYERMASIGVCIPMDEWSIVAARSEARGILEFPYHRAIESVWTETVRRGFRNSQINRNSVLAFVHDEESYFPVLSVLYNEFKKLNPKTAKYLVGFSQLDDKLNPPLQAADLIANRTLEIGLDWMDTGKGKAKETELHDSLGFLAVWREDYMRGVLHHELRRRQLPIPADLLEEAEAKNW
jgi:hypothetical protein